MSIEKTYQKQEILDLIVQQKELNFRPGALKRYCNSGYFLLGIIIERVTGMPLGKYAEEQIFKPLGMSNTFFHYDPERKVKNLALGHVAGDDGKFRIEQLQDDACDVLEEQLCPFAIFSGRAPYSTPWKK